MRKCAYVDLRVRYRIRANAHLRKFDMVPIFTKKSLSLKNWRQGLSKWDGVFFATWSEEGPL